MSNSLTSAISTQMNATLASGLSVLSAKETLNFVKYTKTILPIDGFVFWLAGPSIEVEGSLHAATGLEIREDETIAINQVVFTTTNEITELNTINQQVIWVAYYKGSRFAFSQKGMYFEQAGLYHYSGAAVWSALSTQLIDNKYSLPTDQIVSNSLPFWLQIQSYSPFYLTGTNPTIPLFPSFLAPSNYLPLYGTVHIEPIQTKAIASAPYLSHTASHWQLATDHVRITLYGATNKQAMDFVDTVNQYTLQTENFGIMNMPLFMDEKRPQNELQAIAMKKTIEYDIDYNQYRANTIARQLIEKALVNVTIATPTFPT